MHNTLVKKLIGNRANIRLYISMLLTLFTFAQLSFGQIAKNTWRDHLNFNQAKMVAIADDKIYCATNQALFYYSKSDASLQKITPINNLAEIGIGAIAWQSELQKLIVGYNSGNIDLFFADGSKMNFPDLKQKSLVADKNIYHIDIYDSIAYLSCGFGLVAFNLEKQEFADTYILGTEGNYLKINGSAVYQGFLYVFTDAGLMRGDLSNPFLGDLKNWSYVTDMPNPGQPINTGTVFNDQLVINTTFANSDSCNILAFNGETWEVKWTLLTGVKSISQANNRLVIAEKWNMRVYSDFEQSVNHMSDGSGMHGLAEKDNTLWYASNYQGLVKVAGGQKVTIFPDGPATSNFFNIDFNSGAMLVAPGGLQTTGAATYKQADVYVFNDEKWSSLDLINLPEIQPLRNVINFAPTSKSNHYFAATWTNGIIEIDGSKVINYNQDNTDSIIGNQIGGCALDNQGNLWMSMAFRNEPIGVKTSDGKFYSYSYGTGLSMSQAGRIFIDSHQQIWVVTQRGAGILVVDANGTPENRADDRYKFFENIKNEEGASQNNEINVIVEDLNGTIWLGTNEGIQVYDYPQEVLDENSFYARRPLMVVDGYYQELLGKEVITGIVVDGGNRKWISTDGGGLYLVSPDGTEQYAVYNTDNSPLYSNNVISIALNENTGELFVGTLNGLQSLMTTSTKGKESYADIYVFPNPVRPEFTGLITIRGLMQESVVKITDMAGNLVYETESMGGDAVWNGKNLVGGDVVAGTYLVFCATKDGSGSGITKIQIIK